MFNFDRLLGSPRMAFIGLGAFAALFAGLIGLSNPEAPPPMPEISEAAKKLADGPPAPKLQRYGARDGTPLAYRHYSVDDGAGAPTDAPWAAILIGGSGGSSLIMNRLGHGLAKAGIAAFALDVRGQGRSGEEGHIDYVGQLEHDLEDFLAVAGKAYPAARFALVGHSSGGGFALRVAGQELGQRFAQFVLLAPYLGHDAPSTRPDSGGWAGAAVRRIIGLSFVNSIGITAFNHLPVLAFALPPAEPGEDDGLTHTWSFNMWRNFGPGTEPVADAGRSPAPITIIAGAADEIMIAQAYAEMFAQAENERSRVGVTLLPGVGHIDLLGDGDAIGATVAAIKGETGRDG